MNLGKSLKIAIAKSEMKQKDLAELLGTSPQQVSNWVSSGSIKQSSIVDICTALNMPVSEFVKLGEG